MTAGLERSDQNGRVVHRLIDDQVRNDPRIGVDHVASLNGARTKRRVIGDLDRVVVVRQIVGWQVGAVRAHAVAQRDVPCRNPDKTKVMRHTVHHDRRPKDHAVIAFAHPSRRRCPREFLVSGTKSLLAGQDVVVAAINVAQAPRDLRVRQQPAEKLLTAGIRFRDLDLLKDEVQVVGVDGNHDVIPALYEER